MKILEYKTVIGCGTDNFDMKVNKAVQAGWEPIGNMISEKIEGTNKGHFYLLPMVKYESTATQTQPTGRRIRL